MTNKNIERMKKMSWEGTDNASWLMRQKKKVQLWIMEKLDMRGLPKTIIKIGGAGDWRYENSKGTYITTDTQNTQPVYLSRIQCWKRWAFIIQWPLFFNFHIIWRKLDMVEFPTYKSNFGVKKMFAFQLGFKRDSDEVFWPTAFIGGNFE